MIQARIDKTFSAEPGSVAYSLRIDLQARAGITVLFGPSGSGKTLTLDCIAGFAVPDHGRILLDDHILFDAEARVNLPPQQRHCGYVFQNYALFPHMTLRQNLQFALQCIPRAERVTRLPQMLDTFHLADVSARYPQQLSGGQKQRCSIARALIGSPKILLLDEPVRGLDAPLRAELYATLRQVRKEFGTPILLVTHDLDEAFELADELVILREGALVQAGTPADIVERPANADVARLLGIFNLLPVEVRALDPSRNTSRLRYLDFDLQGPYLPGHLIGDHVWLCARPERLRAIARDGRPGSNQIPAVLTRAVEKPRGVRLEFGDALSVEVPKADYDAQKHAKEWLIEFPQSAMRVL